MILSLLVLTSLGCASSTEDPLAHLEAAKRIRPRADAGTTSSDAGTVTPDAGTTTPDGGAPLTETIFGASDLPAATEVENQIIELGVKFRASVNGQVTGLRFYKAANDVATHTLSLWSASGALLASATTASETASGWQKVALSSPVTIAANTTYVASYLTPQGRYAVTVGGFGTAKTNGSLTALADGQDGANGVFRYGGGFPSAGWNASNYWVDVQFVSSSGAPTEVCGNGTCESGETCSSCAADCGTCSTGGTCSGTRMVWGAQFNDGGNDADALANVMAARRLRRARMGFYVNDPTDTNRFINQATVLRAHGLEIETVLANEYTATENCTQDLAVVEQNAYSSTLTGVRKVQNLVKIFELQNEVSLWLVPGTEGTTAAEFDTPCGRLQAANLRGMSRAIVDERKSSGQPLTILLGAVGRSWGFLTYMEQQGVVFDHVGYHIYPWEGHDALDHDLWYGTGGPLGQLAKFNRPIHINEFNCGEIYSGSWVYPSDPLYENQAGKPMTEQCLRSLAKHLKEIVHQTVANIESLSFYELRDEPWKQLPENHFGLMYDAASPKVHLYLASAFSGGTLSSAEMNELTSRNLVTSAELSSWAGCGAR